MTAPIPSLQAVQHTVRDVRIDRELGEEGTASASKLRRWAPGLVAFLLLTGVSWFLFVRYAYLHYDTIYALAWGQGLADGQLPRLDAPNAPTPHPLAILSGFIAALLAGDGSYDLMLALTALSFALLVFAVYLLGARAFNMRVGVLSALLTATSYPLLARTGESYFDVPAVGLVVLAGAMEAARPRRGLPVLLVLTAAGLLRPEAWLLSAAYLAYLAPSIDRSRLARAALVAAIAPAVWLSMDLALVGDPLHSLVNSKEGLTRATEPAPAPEPLSPGLPREEGSESAPSNRLVRTVDQFGSDVRDTVRLPLIAGGLLGLGFGLLAARRGCRVPLTLLALGSLTYLLIGIGGFYLTDRFAFLAAIMLMVFCSLAAVGWIRADLAGPLRWGWIGAGPLVLLLIVGTAPNHAERLGRLRDATAERSAMSEDLRRLARLPGARAAFASCPSITAQNYRGRPLLAYVLDREPAEIGVAMTPPSSGAYVVATTPAVEEQYLRQEADQPPFAKPPFDGFREAARNRSFVLFTKGCGA